MYIVENRLINGYQYCYIHCFAQPRHDRAVEIVGLPPTCPMSTAQYFCVRRKQIEHHNA